jgi:hypothetical protein
MNAAAMEFHRRRALIPSCLPSEPQVSDQRAGRVEPENTCAANAASGPGPAAHPSLAD